MTIEQSNRMITELMEVKEVESSYDSYGTDVPIYFTRNNGYRGAAYREPGLSYEDYIKHAQYHSSWEWLMPVIEKINSLDSVSEVAIRVEATRIWMKKAGYIQANEYPFDEIHLLPEDAMIIRCYKTVIKFLTNQK